jgi:hypothetical protein
MLSSVSFTSTSCNDKIRRNFSARRQQQEKLQQHDDDCDTTTTQHSSDTSSIHNIKMITVANAIGHFSHVRDGDKDQDAARKQELLKDNMGIQTLKSYRNGDLDMDSDKSESSTEEDEEDLLFC